MYITNGSIVSSFAISTSLLLIVISSVFTGTALPFALARLGIDPANAGTSIQVSWYESDCTAGSAYNARPLWLGMKQ